MAPPRMLPGFVDTLASTASLGWWGSDASAPRGLGDLTNQLAAMPSLHVGWAVWVPGSSTGGSRRWVRLLGVAYPVGTTLVVVSTANHYLLDAVAGAAVVAVASGCPAGSRQPRAARRPLVGDSRSRASYSTANGLSVPASGSVVVSSSCPSGASRVTTAPLALGAPAPGSTSTTAPVAPTASRASGRPGRW